MHQVANLNLVVTRTLSGAGQGIGRCFAHALGEAGAAVAVVDLDGKKAQEVADELQNKGIRCVVLLSWLCVWHRCWSPHRWHVALATVQWL